ncbi:DUF58 domain-containing protein [Mycolicibacterium thermoresistibile]
MTAPAAAEPVRCSDVELRWRASPLTLALATCVAVVLAGAVIGSRWQLVVFAAPLIGVLASVVRQPAPPRVRVRGHPDLHRCFEGEQVQVTVSASTEPPELVARLTLATPAAMELADTAHRSGRVTATVAADRWGRYPVQARVDVIAGGGLLAGTGTVDAVDVVVFPLAPPESTALPRGEMRDRLGTHLTSHTGSGVEYADIRPYVPGDQLRTVNWSVSARRGRLHVTQRLSERAADVMVLIDTYPQPPGPATEATERIARGAVQVVQSALRSGDRAGIAALGGRHPRWLGADIGRRQFYRVLDTMLDAGVGFEPMHGTLVPRPAVPPEAIIVAFSTLLDTDFALALIDLARRGHVVVAVDVLEGAPFDRAQDPLASRMWSLQRSFMYRDMRTIGVDVVAWGAEHALDQILHVVTDHRRRTRRRVSR